MRVMSKRRLIEFWQTPGYEDAEKPLTAWYKTVCEASWDNIDDVRNTYRTADPVQVKSKRTVTVFNIKGNAYRLITAIHYNTQTIYILKVLTHKEYDKERWKVQL